MGAFVLEGMTVTTATAVFCTPASRPHGPASAGAAACRSPPEAGVHQQIFTTARCAAACVMLRLRPKHDGDRFVPRKDLEGLCEFKSDNVT